MKKADRPRQRDIVIAVGVLAGCAIAAALGLATLAKPAEADEQAALVEARIEQAQRLLRPPRAPPSLPVDAACASAEDQAAALRQAVSEMAQQARVEVLGVDARAEAVADPQAKFTPVRLRFEATGPYEGVVSLLGALAAHRPLVFVDVVDLNAKTSVVTLAFSGRVFCSASL